MYEGGFGLSELPRGTVTFLFTDIEGSTPLWERHPQRMQAALAQHDRVIISAVAENQGAIVKNTGDGFYTAFSSVIEAVTAAVKAQKQLQKTSWDPLIGPLKSRMAIHSGTAEPTAGDYFGPAVNRASRLCSAAHGGQILLSAPAQALVAGELGPELTLIDLGLHQLKGFVQKESIFQLAGVGLAPSFPDLQNVKSDQHNLPVQLTAFTGRERQLVELTGLIRRDDVRLVTLSGPGGTGKTRLSLALAEEVLDDFPGGVRFIELAHINEADQVMPAIAETLGVPTSSRRPAAKAVARYFDGRQALLVLDNFEQVVKAGPEVAKLLSRTAVLKILVTSREILRVYGEHDYPLSPLTLPAKDGDLTAAVLSQNEAVSLFRQRANAANPGFHLTEENAPAVVAICRRLDGLPLAIELAAAQLRFMQPKMLLDRLEKRLPFFPAGPRDIPERQRTIEATIDWSYALLDEGEKALFDQLSIFVDGWTLEAAEAVCLVDDSGTILPSLASLRDKSLIQQAMGISGETRFTMLETVRSYSWKKIKRGGLYEQLAKRHIQFCVGIAGRDPRSWIRQYGPKAYAATFFEEYGNIKAAMKRALDLGQWSQVLEIAIGRGIIDDYLPLDARLEFLSMAEKALDRNQGMDPELRAKALFGASNLLSILPGRTKESGDRAQEALTIRRNHDLPDLRFSVNQMAIINSQRGNYDEALALFEEALQLTEEKGDSFRVAVVTSNLASLLASGEDLDEAYAVAHRAIRLCTQEKAYGVRAICQLTLAGLELTRGNSTKARELAELSLQHVRQYGQSHWVSMCLTSVGRVAIHQKEFEQAREYLLESLQILEDYTEDEALIQAIEATSELLTASHSWRESATLLGSSSSLREEAMLVRLPLAQQQLDEQMAKIREHLTQDELEKAWDQGRGLDWEASIALAKKLLDRQT